jgi:hypothetical protein
MNEFRFSNRGRDHDHKDLKELHRIDEELKRIEATDERILSDLDTLVAAALHVPLSVTIYQRDQQQHQQQHQQQQQHRQGDQQMAITGINAGGNNSFGVTTSPAGSVFAAGTTLVWSVDDTADISLTPSADGLSVATACSATPVQTSCSLTFTATPTTGPVVTATVNVPILPAAVPVPTSVTINQLS